METCEICQQILPSSDFQELTCQHIFCLKCLRTDLETKIEKETVSKKDIICLKNDCEKPINPYLLKEILSSELYEKYENLRRKRIEEDLKEQKNEENIKKETE